jgi:hypothetical protein
LLEGILRPVLALLDGGIETTKSCRIGKKGAPSGVKSRSGDAVQKRVRKRAA